MPFTDNRLIAPQFGTPRGDRYDHKPPVVSLVRSGRPVEEGVRLHHNRERYGYLLGTEIEGLGVAPVELQTAPLAGGGSVFRHARLTEGDMFLPITLATPVPSTLPDMYDRLVRLTQPGRGAAFDIIVYEPYAQETRTRTLIFEELTDPVRESHNLWKVGITGRFVDPYWYGVERVLERKLGALEKKFITAKQGQPDPNNPSTTYSWEGEPHASPSVKRVDGNIVARNLVPNPSFEAGTGYLVTTSSISNIWRNTAEAYSIYGEYNTRIQYAGTGSATSLWVYENVSLPDDDHSWLAFGMNIGQNFSGQNEGFRLVIRPRDSGGGGMGNFRGDANVLVRGNADTRYVMAIELPEGAVSADVGYEATSNPGGSWVNPASDTSYYIDGLHANTAATEADALAQVATYFDGDTPNELHQIDGYELPFFPIMVGGSTIQNVYELQVEGDAPAYWDAVITGPGTDLQIMNHDGDELFIEGQINEPIIIQTRPQERDITLADGTPIWRRLKDPKKRKMFLLEPGRNVVKISMVGASPESSIVIRYREAFYHSLGGGS